MTFWEIALVVVVLISFAEFLVWVSKKPADVKVPKEWQDAEDKTGSNTDIIGRHPKHPKDPPDENSPT
ncbi:MAG: hypothetical protein HYT03_02990 [Candidatus Harrisonbacteria bacterium]|nr:hypothetical protein [Candidatus Harrisonbacteria bacterium]